MLIEVSYFEQLNVKYRPKEAILSLSFIFHLIVIYVENVVQANLYVQTNKIFNLHFL